MSELLRRRLCQRIHHDFSKGELLTTALTHRSFSADHNERLEFLGDSVLGQIVGEWLYRRFPEATEGQLSRLRSRLVKGDTLAEMAREFDLGPCIRLGEGELKNGGQQRSSILADCVEAIIGAIYLDSDLRTTADAVLTWYKSRLDTLKLSSSTKDPKTELQEYLQARREPLPDYEVVETTGDAHEQTFKVHCKVAPLKQPTIASGRSRRIAEKQAAAKALAILRGEMS